ncbi:MAG TPA: protein kinase [Conexibacter sp.]|nr:protein kinase [Conexibacter sp.]
MATQTVAPCIFDAGEETRYRLVEQMESGGEGLVWRGWQLDDGGGRLPVAVKLLTPYAHLGETVESEDVLRRWRRQAQTMRNFSHDGFASVQTVFRVASGDVGGCAPPEWMWGLPAFVISWVDGPHLGLWSRSVADPLRRLRVLERCAAGLDAFHRETGHVHRDLKPANVVVAGERGRIVDFGLVRSIAQLRGGSAISGSEGYVAPELFDDAEYTPETDRYAFAGVVYHQMTLADPPSSRRGRLEDVRRRMIDAGCSDAASLVALALHPDPQARPQLDGVAELLARVLALLEPASHRVYAEPPPAGPRPLPATHAAAAAPVAPADGPAALRRPLAFAVVLCLLVVVLALLAHLLR